MPTIPPLFDGIQTVTATENTITITSGGGAPTPREVTVGDYFLRSHTGAPADTAQLMEAFLTAVQVVHAGCTIAFNAETGRVTITNTDPANALTIVFTDHSAAGDVDVGVMLGLIAVTAGVGPTIGPIAANGGTFTGPVEPYYIWRPDEAPADLFGDLTLVGLRRSDTIVTLAPGGRGVTTKGHEQVVQAFLFEGLDDERTVPLDATVNSYEQFWQRILSTGRRFRYYPERGDWDGATGAGPFTYFADAATASGGSTSVDRTIERSTDLYNLRVGVHLYVAAP